MGLSNNQPGKVSETEQIGESATSTESARATRTGDLVDYIQPCLPSDGFIEDPTARQISRAQAAQREPLHYVIGSWFLHEAFRYCTQTGCSSGIEGGLTSLFGGEAENEWMHYATGVMVSGVRTIERIVPFQLAKQSPGFVQGDEAATRDALIEMSEYGYALHAVCHSHPGKGKLSTLPSHIDMDHQERLERGGYPVVSGIFSRDGYVRFFTVNRPFCIEVYGEGVKHVEPGVFYLTACN